MCTRAQVGNGAVKEKLTGKARDAEEDRSGFLTGGISVRRSARCSGCFRIAIADRLRDGGAGTPVRMAKIWLPATRRAQVKKYRVRWKKIGAAKHTLSIRSRIPP